MSDEGEGEEHPPPFAGWKGILAFLIWTALIALWMLLRHPIFTAKQILRAFSPWHELKEVPDEWGPPR